MSVNLNAVVTSVAFMCVVSTAIAATEEYEIKYNGSVVENSCVISGNGKDLVVDLEPVFVRDLESAQEPIGMKYIDGAYSVICDGDLDASVAFGGSLVKEQSPVGNNTWGLVPREDGADVATGVLVHTYLAVKSNGKYEYPSLINDGHAWPIDLTKNDDGYYVGGVGVRAGYIPRNVSSAENAIAVTPGVVTATAPIVLSYK